MSKRAEMWEKKRLAFLQNQNSASNAGGTGASNKVEHIERVWNENRVQEPAQPIKREDFKMVDVGMPAQDRDRSRTEVHVSKPPGIYVYEVLRFVIFLFLFPSLCLLFSRDF